MRIRTMPTSRLATTLPPSWCWTSSRVTWWPETAGGTELRGLWTLLRFVGWPYSPYAVDPAHFLRLTLLSIYCGPCSLFRADPTLHMLWTLLSICCGPYSDPTLHLLCTYSAPTLNQGVGSPAFWRPFPPVQEEGSLKCTCRIPISFDTLLSLLSFWRPSRHI